MLINKKFDGKVTEITTDPDGRYVRMLVTKQERMLAICAIYAPNKDSPQFFTDLLIKTHEMTEAMLVIGDFNTVLDTTLDRNMSMSNNIKSTERIKEHMSELLLKDAWRCMNPTTRRYSWYRRNPYKPNHSETSKVFQGSRIDFSLVSENLMDRVHNCFYLNELKTDHSAMFIGIELEHIERGNGYWKLNTSMLTEIEFINKINEVIATSIRKNQCVQHQDKWEILKKDIKKEANKYCRRNGAEEKLAISQLTEQVTLMEEQLDTLAEPDLKLLEDTKIDLEELQFKRTKGLMFRSKAKWNFEGEKNTKYFMNLEKRRAGAKTCTKLIADGQEITNKDSILQAQQKYYQQMYTADPDISFHLTDNIEYKVNEEDIAAQENEFSEAEIRSAIKGLKNNSCPRSDGLPSEFYKVFWKQIQGVFMDMVRAVFKNEYLHKSARRGILNLIPKGDKDTRILGNMRPITLLNVDYKIIEKAIANRMVPALNQVIHPDQTGFLPNRRIAVNIRRILDIVNAGEECPEETDGVVISCDFLKCFDRIEFDAVSHALRFFGFSDYIHTWIHILYKDFMLKVQNGGFFSSDIKVSRSVHQGGPASNAIFLCVAELIAVCLRTDNEIRGIYVKNIIKTLSQYADDMDISIKNCQKSMDKVLYHLEQFRKNTGFELSYEKTSLYRVGSMANERSYRFP